MREKERKERPEVESWAAGLFCLSFFFSFFLSTLKPFKPFHLNSNKFESKPNTNKPCTSMNAQAS
jgi:hypothetical protein